MDLLGVSPTVPSGANQLTPKALMVTVGHSGKGEILSTYWQREAKKEVQHNVPT